MVRNAISRIHSVPYSTNGGPSVAEEQADTEHDAGNGDRRGGEKASTRCPAIARRVAT